MILSDLTERKAVLKAIKEYDRLNGDRFLKKYGYAKARQYELKHGGKTYPSKAIFGVAWMYQFGKDPLLSNQFNGGLKTVVPVLKRMGFSVQSIHQNPDWIREEVILALNLYYNLNGKRISKNTPEIIELSDLLIALPLHPLDTRLPTFRNPNGVANKLSNFLSLDPKYDGVGYGHFSQCDKDVWKEFYDDRKRLAKEAKTIISFWESNEAELAGLYWDEDEELSAPEGRLRAAIHKKRERNRSLVKKKKDQALKRDGCLKCEVCDFDFNVAYTGIPKPYIECHHTTPLSELKPNTKTSLSDLSLVCANCHRMLHAFRPEISVNELKQKIQKLHKD